LSYRILITLNAQKNLEEIVSYLKQESKNRAYAWLKRVQERIQSLQTNPRRCRQVPEYSGDKEIRELLFGAYRIIFEMSSDEIFVLYVYHGARLLKLKKQRRDVD